MVNHGEQEEMKRASYCEHTDDTQHTESRRRLVVIGETAFRVSEILSCPARFLNSLLQSLLDSKELALPESPLLSMTFMLEFLPWIKEPGEMPEKSETIGDRSSWRDLLKQLVCGHCIALALAVVTIGQSTNDFGCHIFERSREVIGFNQ